MTNPMYVLWWLERERERERGRERERERERDTYNNKNKITLLRVMGRLNLSLVIA